MDMDKMKKLIVFAVVILAIFALGCDIELGHVDHDHDGDGVQDHAAEDHDEEEDHHEDEEHSVDLSE